MTNSEAVGALRALVKGVTAVYSPSNKVTDDPDVVRFCELVADWDKALELEDMDRVTTIEEELDSLLGYEIAGDASQDSRETVEKLLLARGVVVEVRKKSGA